MHNIASYVTTPTSMDAQADKHEKQYIPTYMHANTIAPSHQTVVEGLINSSHATAFYLVLHKLL